MAEEFSSHHLAQLSCSQIKPKIPNHFGSNQQVFLGVFLIYLILLDLFLTNAGINYWGVEAEGNNLLKSLMLRFGSEKALLYVKGTSLILAIFLIYLAKSHHLIQKMIGLICLLHLLVAVIPWIYLLYYI